MISVITNDERPFQMDELKQALSLYYDIEDYILLSEHHAFPTLTKTLS